MALLNKDKLNEDYQDALTSMRPWWDNFDEYERLRRNKPHPKVVAAKLPTVTDGTLAGVIRSQPKRVVQQIPTGRLTSPDMEDVSDAANYIIQNEVLPNANYNGDPIRKSWNILDNAMTHGCGVSYAFFKQSGDYFGADWSLPYIRDIIFQRGKAYGPDCKKLYMRQWYTEEDIKTIIDKENRLSRNAKRRAKADNSEGDYEATWNKAVLRAALKKAKNKNADAKAAAEKTSNSQSQAPVIEILHAFEEGVGSTFYSFCPDLPDGKNIAKTKSNPDPTGKMPISFLYIDYDLVSPLGIGYVELSGGMQNLLDSEVQSYQLMQKLMLAPPVMKWGKGIKGSTIKFKTNAVWDMGNDANSKIETVDIHNEAIANFANNYGLIKSQILNLTNNQDSSVAGSTNGSTNQSKTAQGVHQQEAKIGFDDNYVRKSYEGWYQDNLERVANIHFAESDGNREIELTQDFIEDTLPTMDKTNVMQVDEVRKKATVLYGEITDVRFKFTVDPTSSESPDDADQVTNLQSLLSDISANPYIPYYLMNSGWKLNMGELYRDLIQRLGVANIQKILTKIDQNDPSAQQSASSSFGPAFDKPQLRVQVDKLPLAAQAKVLETAGANITPQDFGLDQNGQPLPDALGQPTADPAHAPAVQAAPQNMPNAQPQQEMKPGDKALAEAFTGAGYSDSQAMYAIELMNQGYQHNDVLKALGPPTGGGK